MSGEINAEMLAARAREIGMTLKNAGADASTPITMTDEKTGAIFTYKLDDNGKPVCTYKYTNQNPKDIILFKRNTVPTSSAGLGYVTDEQLEEFTENHPNHMYATKYAADDEAIARKENLEEDLNSYDKKTRKEARKEYRAEIRQELINSGSFDKKSAKKMAKYATQDAIAGQRADSTYAYNNKAEYKTAKKELKTEQKAAKERIKTAQKAGQTPNEKDMLLMETEVKYIRDKDVRKYTETHKDRFYDEKGNFDSDKYRDWAYSHNQGDNTMTVDERKEASLVTGLSKGDMKRAEKYAGYDVQKDPTIAINLAKTAVGVLAGPLVAYCTNHNIHSVTELQDRLDIVADESNNTIKVLIDGVSIAEAKNEVRANFRNVAVRNAAIGSLLGTAAAMWINPEKTVHKLGNARTAATIATQNIYRGKENQNVEGAVEIAPKQEVVVNPNNDCDPDDDTCKAKIDTEPGKGKEAVTINTGFYIKNGKRYARRMHQFSSCWTDENGKPLTSKEAIAFRNKFRKERLGGRVDFNTKDQKLIPEFTFGNRTWKFDAVKYMSLPPLALDVPKGKGKGRVTAGQIREVGTGNAKVYKVYNCEGQYVGSYLDPASAKTEYKRQTGNDYQGKL